MVKSVFYKDDEKARNKISQVIEDFLTPWLERCNKARTQREGTKHTKDAELLANYHTRESLREVAWFSYLCLKTLHHEVCVKKEVKLTPSLLFKATAYLVATIYTNTPPSRSKEIETLLTESVMSFPFMDIDFAAVMLLCTYFLLK